MKFDLFVMHSFFFSFFGWKTIVKRLSFILLWYYREFFIKKKKFVTWESRPWSKLIMVHGDYLAIIDNDPYFLTFFFFNFSIELLVFAKYNMIWYVYRATGEKDVTFKVLFCGICHSDLHMVKNEWGSSIYPLIPGYVNVFLFFFDTWEC